LRFKGKPLDDRQTLRLALNNYRAAGSAGYGMFRDAKILWRSNEEIRDLMVEYYTQQKRLPEKADNNWKIVPDAAHKTLQAEVREEARRSGTY
jgi:2',3'-cyclic-nucleotide 2'-phosphodiesterase/3'-nucleotidase